MARLPSVRAILVDRQRQMGASGGIVMEGRDIGTVVFPNADVKVYLDASPEERARRRAIDPAHTGGPAAVSDVASALIQRDEIDRTRKASPLYAAADAVIVDTTGKSIDEVVREVLAVVEMKRARGWAGARGWGLRREAPAPPSPQPRAPTSCPCSLRPTRDPVPSGACRARRPCRPPSVPRCPRIPRPTPCRCRRRCPDRGWGCRRRVLPRR